MFVSCTSMCACVCSEKQCVLFDDAVSLSRGVWYVAWARYVCVVYVHVCVRACVCSEKHCVLFDDAVSLSRGVWYVACGRYVCVVYVHVCVRVCAV